MTLPQLAEVDEPRRAEILRDAQRSVARAHGASSIYDAANFNGCPAQSEVNALARIDAVAEGLTADEARAALDAARAAADTIASDLASGRFRDAPSVTRAGQFLAASQTETDPELAELLRRAAKDQYLRGMSSGDLLEPDPADGPVVEAVYRRLMWPVVCGSDADNAEWMRATLAQKEWFLESEDGELAASAAWLIVRHADGSPDLQRTVLARLEPLVETGEVPASRYAYLFDRVSLAESGRQLVMVRDAVRTGVGAGRLPISLVSHDLADGSLVQWGSLEGPEIALCTLYPTRRLLSARVAAFLEHLREAFPQGTPDELAAYLRR